VLLRAPLDDGSPSGFFAVFYHRATMTNRGRGPRDCLMTSILSQMMDSYLEPAADIQRCTLPIEISSSHEPIL
jgi:hypothetical protein